MTAILGKNTRSLPSMAPRHTVHPEHKKAQAILITWASTF